MDGDVVANGELDVAAVEHRQGLVLLLVRLVGAGQVDAVDPLLEDRRAVRGLDGHLALEHPGPLPVGGRRLDPFVHEEQRDAPVIVPAADQPLELGIGEGLVGDDRPHRPRLEPDFMGGAAARSALPDPLGRPGLGICKELAGSLVVVPPPGRDLQGGGFERDAEGEPEGRREDRLGRWGRAFGGSVVAAQAAPADAFDTKFLAGREVAFENVVILTGRRGRLVEQWQGLVLGPLAGSQDADEVAVPDAFGDLLIVALGWSLEFLDRHRLQHVPQDEGRRDRLLESQLGHVPAPFAVWSGHSMSGVRPLNDGTSGRCIRSSPSLYPE